MSEFLSKRLTGSEPYTPGEQPKRSEYIKLNTNENPYPPTRHAVNRIDVDVLERARLYCDPDCTELTEAIAEFYGVSSECVLATNGSDEALAFCFAAFGDRGAVFPDITYGFYKVFARLFGVAYGEIPLRDDFTVNVDDYANVDRMVVLANPNAQTGIALSFAETEKIIKTNKNSVVVVDEAYVDFGGESAIKLTGKYNNVVVVQTFSKSRALAGARVGFAVACKELIDDLKRVKFSFNPYNVNSISALLAVEAIKDAGYFKDSVEKIIATRERLTEELVRLGYRVLPSSANFVLAESPRLSGEELYRTLKSKGVLVRHFDEARITDFVRITVGTDEQTDALIKAIKQTENLL